MYEQSFGRENHCSPYLDAGRTVCMLKCIQRNDYGMLRNQFTRESRTLRMGVLFLGNIDMHKNMEEILKRYRGYGKTVRIVSITGNEDEMCIRDRENGGDCLQPCFYILDWHILQII